MAQCSDDLEVVAKRSGYGQRQIAAQRCYWVDFLTLENLLSNFQQLFAGVRQICPRQTAFKAEMQHCEPQAFQVASSAGAHSLVAPH